MKLLKLNNKGLTAVEILVCFALMVVLVVSMYSTVTTYKNKQNIESDRDKIVAYKNLLTKEIQDDLVKKGLVDAKVLEELNTTVDRYYKVELIFRDGTKKILEVKIDYARDFGACMEDDGACQNDKDDVLVIGYGSAPGAADYSEYPLPDLGYGYNGNIFSTNLACSGNTNDDGSALLAEGDRQGCKIYDFRINNVIVTTEDNIFGFYVGFYHPDLETRYGIDIVCPINYF